MAQLILQREKGKKKFSVDLKLYVVKFPVCEDDGRTFLPHQREHDNGSHI